jgi:uncharacterized membrane protein YoaK (UPF0700 family)
MSSSTHAAQSTPPSTPPATPDEKKPDPVPQKRISRAQWLRDRAFDDLTARHADLILIACFFISGILDSVAYSTWGAFFSMQTGNTLFFALGLTKLTLPDHHDLSWVRSACSIVAYLIGCIFFALLHRFTHKKRRITMVGSFLVQDIFIFIAAALVQTHVASDAQARGNDPEPYTWTNLAPLMLVAFQSAGQIVASRELNYNELPTNVLTSLYTDLLSDAHLFSPWDADVKRNRRAVAIVLFFVGGLIGGFMSQRVGMPSVLWLGGSIKGALVVVWIFWMVEEEKKDSPDLVERAL